MKKGISLITPTYNRAYILPVLYNSLCIQSCKDFEWIIIDDGSNDGTNLLVDTWKKEKKVNIRYVYQNNSGKSQAHNHGMSLAKYELCACVDSDDYLKYYAVENIISDWNKHNNEIGIIYKRENYEHIPITIWKNGFISKSCTLFDAYRKFGLYGDAWLIYDTKIMQKHSFPKFENEKFVPEAYLFDQLDQEGLMLTVNKTLYIGGYLSDGYTASMQKLLFNNPKGYNAYIVQRLKLQDNNLKLRFSDTIRYIANKIVMHDKRILKDSVYPLLTILLFPFGYILYLKKFYQSVA